MLNALLGTLLFISNSFAIENSEPVRSAEFNHVVQIEIYFNNNDYGQCGGVVISSRKILTARHCFAGSDGIEKIRVNLGESLTFKNGRPYYKATQKILASVEQRGESLEQMLIGSIPSADDYITIQTESPIDVEPAEVVTRSEFDAVFKNSRHSQFLAVSVNLVEYATTLETRRGVEVKGLELKGFLPRNKYIGPRSYKDLLVQPGDSGSPLFVNIKGKWKVIGVTKGMRTNYPKGTAYCPIHLDKL